MTEPKPPTLRDYADAWARVAEQMRPVFQRVAEAVRPLAEFAQSPQGQAFIAAHEAALRAREEQRNCHCLGAKSHPGRAVCRRYVPTRDVRQVRFTSDLLGDVDVPMCPPCASAALAGAGR